MLRCRLVDAGLRNTDQDPKTDLKSPTDLRLKVLERLLLNLAAIDLTESVGITRQRWPVHVPYWLLPSSTLLLCTIMGGCLLLCASILRACKKIMRKELENKKRSNT